MGVEGGFETAHQLQGGGLLAAGEFVAPAQADAVLGAEAAAEGFGYVEDGFGETLLACLLYTSPSPRDGLLSRMPSSA